ncbi:MAG: glycosyltransferase family 1 protein [Fuerstia sp.]|nr:glycosyltransferase family 1 protein [Fuerstiella sp.]
MRIAIICEVYLPKVDGVVGRTLNLIQQLLNNGDEVIVVCPKVALPRNSPVPLIEFPGFPCASYPEYVIGRPDQRFIQELRAFHPDVVHFLNPFAFGFQCCDLLSRSDLRVPMLFSFHTLYGEFVKQYPGLRPLSRVLWWLTRSYHNTADQNLTVSSVMADDLRSRGFARVALWPPAVDSALYSPDRRNSAMRRRLCGSHPESPLLLTVSRLACEKNVSFLTEVLRRIPEATLAIVGDGPQRAQLERRFAKYRTQFVGYLRGEELAAAYASADAFVYASETETMGNVILEAMASGLPVIAAKAGGVASLIQHGVDGFLFCPRNADEAAGYVREVLEVPKRHQQMSAAALASVQTRTWQNSGDQVRSHYQQIIDEFAESPAVQNARRRPGVLAALATNLLVLMFRLTAPRMSDDQQIQQPALVPSQIDAGI